VSTHRHRGKSYQCLFPRRPGTTSFSLQIAVMAGGHTLLSDSRQTEVFHRFLTPEVKSILIHEYIGDDQRCTFGERTSPSPSPWADKCCWSKLQLLPSKPFITALHQSKVFGFGSIGRNETFQLKNVQAFCLGQMKHVDLSKHAVPSAAELMKPGF